MASVRLTNEIREEVAVAVLRHRFGAELKALVADRAEFALAVYNDLYKAADRKRIAELPEGWLRTSNQISFRASGSYTSMDFGGSFHGDMRRSLPLSKNKDEPSRFFRPFASKHYGNCVATYDGDHKLAVRYSELEQRLKEIGERHKEASAQVKSALARASTTARLKELWPEVAPFVASYEAAAPSLPSIPTERLNALLDLPVSEAA